MSQEIYTGHRLAAALEAEGIPLPKNCYTARIVSTVDCAIALEFACYAEGEDIDKIGKALQRMVKEP